ncbi:hypothetical protein VTL71DRAFT_5421 [Oculimacula yallundae]|uniref:BTB domain-containing protein n=1 Tax=Oculimacula yallundae TaxID=86028 RepID=A0ABR4C2M4_9HELO
MTPVAPRSPIVFKVRCLEPDIRLRVFHTEFHVSSVILKMNSAFFAKYLDSPDKPTMESSTPEFKYEWASRVDRDGSWSLHAVSSNRSSDNYPEALRGRPSYHIQLFHKFLSAIHGESYKIGNVAQLRGLTDLADYYCALPAVSKSVLQPLLENRLNVRDNSAALISIATKLRHKILFQEAAMFLAGYWGGEYWFKPDTKHLDVLVPELREVIITARAAMAFSIASAFQILLTHKNRVPIVALQLSRYETDSDAPNVADVFRCIYQGCDPSIEEEVEVMVMLSDLKDNRILLDSGSVQPTQNGERDYKDYFLCFQISDDDLPWDCTQKDF